MSQVTYSNYKTINLNKLNALIKSFFLENWVYNLHEINKIYHRIETKWVYHIKLVKALSFYNLYKHFFDENLKVFEYILLKTKCSYFFLITLQFYDDFYCFLQICKI